MAFGDIKTWSKKVQSKIAQSEEFKIVLLVILFNQLLSSNRYVNQLHLFSGAYVIDVPRCIFVFEKYYLVLNECSSVKVRTDCLSHPS